MVKITQNRPKPVASDADRVKQPPLRKAVMADKRVTDVQTARLHQRVKPRPTPLAPTGVGPSRGRKRTHDEMGGLPTPPASLDGSLIEPSSGLPPARLARNALIGKPGALLPSECGRDPLAKEVLPTMFNQVKVKGDGNCGFYALTAGILYCAIRRPVGPICVQALRSLRPSDDQMAVAGSRFGGRERFNFDHARLGYSALEHLATDLESGGTTAAKALLGDARQMHYVQKALRLTTFVRRGNNRPDINAWAADEDLQTLLEGFEVGLRVYGNKIGLAEQMGTLEQTDAPSVTLLNHDSVHYTLLLPKVGRMPVEHVQAPEPR